MHTSSLIFEARETLNLFMIPLFKVSCLFEKFSAAGCFFSVKSEAQSCHSLCILFWYIHTNVRLPGEAESNDVRKRRELKRSPGEVLIK